MLFRSYRALATTAIVACTPTAAMAQARGDLLVAGERVRIRVPQSPSWAFGRVDSLSRDTLYLTVDERRVPARVARSDIAQLEIATGHVSRGATIAHSMGVGALSGALVGAAAGAAAGGSPRNCRELCISATGVTGLGGLFGLATGSALGALVGAIRPRPDHWTPVLLSPWGWTLTPASH